ncbi:MAG: extracellular solute-binding protein [Deltaproteobacteria bacterium]|nr:extracellular solute-binding protein [Deltaproteobacteria bacterium]
MKRSTGSGFFVVALLALLGLSTAAFAAGVEELVAAAKKEGIIEFYGPSTLTPQGAQALANAFNKKYRLEIRLGYTPSGSMFRDIGRLATEAASGAPSQWDIMVVTDAHQSLLWLKKLHMPFDYSKLGVDPKLIHYDNGSVSFSNQFVLPAYNQKALPAKDVPKRWDDLLDPKWKGGKLGINNATHHWARLAVGAWGEKKTTEFVKALVKQEPFLGQLGEIYSRLQLGEILLAATLTTSQINTARRTGAPIVFAEGIEPVVSPSYQAGVVKGAPHPNVGYLFSAFMATLGAQEIWAKYGGETSALIAGTDAHKYVQGKQMLYMTQDQAKEVDRLTNLYRTMLGFR